MTLQSHVSMTTTPIAILRERVGISVAELASAVGINEPSCWDLLYHPDEVSRCLTLRQLLRLASALRSPAGSLLPDPPGPAQAQHTLHQLAGAVRSFCSERDISVEQFSEQSGWDVQHFLDLPDSALDDWCLDTLRDVCQTLGVHWPDFLPDATSVV
jgi:hypothetical protein